METPIRGRTLLGALLCVLAMPVGGRAGPEPLDGLFTGLSAQDPLAREEAVRVLSRELSRLERDGDGGPFEEALARLRRLAGESPDADLRAQARKALEPFLAGGIQWERGPAGAKPLPGPVEMLVAEDGLVAAWGPLSEERTRCWVGLYRSGTGETVWEKGMREGDLPGRPFRLAILAEGILIGGGGVGSAGWLGLYDRTTGEPKWLQETGERWIGFLRVLPDRVVTGGILQAGDEVKKQPQILSWLGACSRETGKFLWISEEIPGQMLALQATAEGIVAGGACPSGREKDPDDKTVDEAGWVELRDMTGKKAWRSAVLPARVSGIEVLPRGIAVVGPKITTRTPKKRKGNAGGLIVPGSWMGFLGREDGGLAWTRFSERSGQKGAQRDGYVLSAPEEIPLPVSNAAYREHITGSVVPTRIWSPVYLDEAAQPRDPVFSAQTGVVTAILPWDGDIVAGGADWLARYGAPGAAGRESVWRTSLAPGLKSIVRNGDAVVAVGASAKLAGVWWMSAHEGRTGRELWRMHLAGQIASHAVLPGTVIAGGSHLDSEGRRIGWMSARRLGDADRKPGKAYRD